MTDELLQPLVEREFRRRRALQRVGGDRAEEDAVGLALARQLGQRRRRRGRRDLHHARRGGDRGQDRDRHRRDDAADDRRHLLHLDELGGDVDGDVALALRVAGVGDELAAVAEAAGIVDVAERHLDRLRRRPGHRVAAGPVSSITTPMVTSQSAARASPVPAAIGGQWPLLPETSSS